MDNTAEITKEIKRSFHLMMNGVTSQSMRQKGADYHVNWGVPLPQLREMAKQYSPSYSLAVALWKEDVRECKIMGALLMPPNEMPEDVADIWMEQVHSQDMAEILASELLHRCPWASALAFRWIATESIERQVAGYGILSRLFARGQEPQARAAAELLDQAVTALHSSHVGVRHAAHNTLIRMASISLVHERMVQGALRQEGLDNLIM